MFQCDILKDRDVVIGDAVRQSSGPSGVWLNLFRMEESTLLNSCMPKICEYENYQRDHDQYLFLAKMKNEYFP